jgi:hypothetical protein
LIFPKIRAQPAYSCKAKSQMCNPI